ncbi:MAG: hypothetical protein ABIN55_10110 [Aeromicrobium sp.]
MAPVTRAKCLFVESRATALVEPGNFFGAFVGGALKPDNALVEPGAVFVGIAGESKS